MFASLHDAHPAVGLYEQLITRRLQTRIEELQGSGWHIAEVAVKEADSPRILAQHLSRIIQAHLAEMTKLEQVTAANLILNSLKSTETAKHWIELLTAEPRQLLAVGYEGSGHAHPPVLPSSPLSETTLLTNAKGDARLGPELRAELGTADSVDLLCSFVKWSGLRLLTEELEAAKNRGVPIRVITTTYMGATEQRALDRLVRDFGAQVKVTYEERGTRLHAKAWLFHRGTGYDTAYVGSSNLSDPALLEGLEWNVRLSVLAAPDAMTKFKETFENYWSSPHFEPYDPDDDAERLAAALHRAGWTPPRGGGSASQGQTDETAILPHKEWLPLPHQRDMLERLAVERQLHGRTENLLVAATGTGKTVMAALDFRNLSGKEEPKPKLLFIAHRKEILKQAQATYRGVLGDEKFGSLHVGGSRTGKWNHVFASVQSFASQEFLQSFQPNHFDVIVIDEFHHAAAPTYKRLIEHFKPSQLLGLTATPERRDGKHVHIEHFDGRIAAEMRLWEALDNDLLSPFHYFGIADESADYSKIEWKGGAYDRSQLSDLLGENQQHADLVIASLRDKVSRPEEMRALGFCVSVAHAKFMAKEFRAAGFKAEALDANTPELQRDAALKGLQEGNLQALFSVDLFNEGLDIPDVDTLLFLRPTESVTVYLQQFGRGLRRSRNKEVLTVLDFVGLHRAEYSYEARLRALTNLANKRLIKSIEADFPQLPPGCEIQLDRKSKKIIIDNIKNRLDLNIIDLANEVRDFSEPNLAKYLEISGREIKEIYRNDHSWTELLRRAGFLPRSAPEGEKQLCKRMTVFLHTDDPDRVQAYKYLLSDAALAYGELSAEMQAYARMLFFAIWPEGGDFSSYEEGFAMLRTHPDFRNEAHQVMDYTLAHTDHLPLSLPHPHADLPLRVHSSYSKEEILSALEEAAIGGSLPGHFREGVRWCQRVSIDALLITLDKSEKDFTPGTRYNDYAISSTRFHSESQVHTSDSTPTGLRYQNHRQGGSHIFLFVRRYKYTDINSPHPWVFLGTADYVSHTGNKPMSIIWDLHYELPGDILAYSTNRKN